MKLTYLSHQFRDGITKQHALIAFAQGKAFEMAPSLRGNDRVMYVVFTPQATLIEVGVEFISQTEAVVFHATKATSAYEKLYGES